MLGSAWKRIGAAAVLGLAAAWLGLGVDAVSGQEPAKGRDGMFVSVPDPITSNVVQRIKQQISEAIDKKKRDIRTIVFDFNPTEQPVGTSDFGPCNDLADFIRRLQLGREKPNWPAMTTVAFIRHETTRFTVLPVLACDQLVFSAETGAAGNLTPRARLGPVGKDLESAITETHRAAFKSLARNYASPDVVMRLLDKDLVLKKVKTSQGVRFMSPASIKEAEDKGTVLTVETGLPSGLEAGRGSFDAETARDTGLAKGTFASRADLAAALRLPRQSMHEDALVGAVPVAWRIEVRGHLDGGKSQSIERRIKKAVSKNANILILHIDAETGDPVHVAPLARVLRDLRDDSGLRPIRTIAYIPPNRSLGVTSLLALGCNEIVMGKDSALADFRSLKAEDRTSLFDVVTPMAREQGYPPLLFQATLDPKISLVRAKAKNDPSEQRLLTEEEYKQDQESKSPKWSSFGRLTSDSKDTLRITAPIAREFEVAIPQEVDSVTGLYSTYALEQKQVHEVRDDWLDQVAEFFREPWVNFLLLMFGIIGLILELKLPGATLPGVISALCFVLFFWAYSFVGEFTLLAVFLFILGLVLIAIEIFVVPGFGVPGISGLVLLITSLALVTLERMPSTTGEWVALGSTLTTFGVALVAALIGAFAVAYYLPSIPGANRLVLKPPAENFYDDETGGPISAASSLLGAMGVAATPLRPAGKAQIGDDFLDVVAEGDYVEAGTRVQIIEIEGNRIVVKRI
jgi:membrane-bound serine protease (ClpP class)